MWLCTCMILHVLDYSGSNAYNILSRLSWLEWICKNTLKKYYVWWSCNCLSTRMWCYVYEKKGKVGQIASLPVSGSTSPRSKLRFSGWAKIQRPNSTHLGELFAFNSNHRRPLQLPSWKRESTPPTNTWPASASLLNWGPKNPTKKNPDILFIYRYNSYPTKPNIESFEFWRAPSPIFIEGVASLPLVLQACATTIKNVWDE